MVEFIKVCGWEEIAGEQFDFVVIGGGTAGSVVAARLSEDPSAKVLLIEAGLEARNDVVKIPYHCGAVQTIPDYTWPFLAEPNPGKSGLGMEGGRDNFPRGKGLGGTGLSNSMVYTRGSSADFDMWASVGKTDPSSASPLVQKMWSEWKYHSVLPFFMKSETCDSRPKDPNSIVKIDDDYHGFNGPVFTSVRQPINPLAKAFVQSVNTLGVPILDYNGARIEGVSIHQNNIKKGRRCDTATAYLTEASHLRPNLKILAGHRALRVVVDERTMTCVGVELEEEQFLLEEEKRWVKGGKKGGQFGENSEGGYFFPQRKMKFVGASKDVVVSCGSISSPQLLLMSGLGPKEELEELGIRCLLDNPDVGKHMEDHLSMFVRARVKRGSGTVTKRAVDTAALEWKEKGEGALASSAADCSYFFVTDAGKQVQEPFPDVQLSVIVSPCDEDFFHGNLRYTSQFNEYEEEEHKIDLDTEGVVFVITHLHPRSRGSVTLKSSHPLEHPVIATNFLDNQHDVEVFKCGAQKMLEVCERGPLSNLEARVLVPPHTIETDPTTGVSQPNWENYARHYCKSLYHPTSTLQMGKVVTPDLKVKGVKGLRVADGSVMPCITSGNTNAPIIMIGEKIVDFMAREHHLVLSSTSSGMSRL